MKKTRDDLLFSVCILQQCITVGSLPLAKNAMHSPSLGRNKMAARTRLSLRLRCHGFKGRALKFHSRGGEPGDEASTNQETKMKTK